MRSILLVAVAAVATAMPSDARAQNGSPLRVVRVTPIGGAGPLAQISVTFDRPVAGSLDRTVDPAAILHVEPAVSGRLEWRDPVTIRLIPSSPFVSGTTYTVTVANTFRAMDGSALAEPHRYSFRADGPTLLTGRPVGPRDAPAADHVAPEQSFELVYSSPVDLELLKGAAYLEFSAACAGGERLVRLVPKSQRRIRDGEGMRIREAGGWQRDRSLDSLRRVVLLAPERPLPRGCRGELVAPGEVASQSTTPSLRWPFETYGDFRLTKLTCAGDNAFCPAGPLTISFTNPVRGGEVSRRLKLVPATPFVIRDTAGESTSWTLEATLRPHVGYAVVADTAMRDVFGQSLRGNPAAGYRTTGYEPAIVHAFGNLLVERVGFRTLAVQHVNVDTLIATVAPVPDSLRARVLGRLAWSSDSVWQTLVRGATVQRIPVRAGTDRPMITGVQLPVPDATQRGVPTLFAVKIGGRATGGRPLDNGPTAIAQVTDLGVHARIGVNEGVVWVTGVSDGVPKRGATVVLHDSRGRTLATARTDAQGLAPLPRWSNPPRDENEYNGGFEGFVSVTLGSDVAVTAINQWDPDLGPWRFNVYSAWGDDRLKVAGAVFTERGIYRPGERVYAKAIIRNGALGALHPPAAGDSIRWMFQDRDEGTLREVTVPLSSFGTSDQSVALPAGAAVGYYRVDVQVKRDGNWRTVGRTSYRVAEYRPPEFLVDLAADTGTRLPGDTLVTRARARYLFGAPMGRAAISWQARQSMVPAWELEIPGMEGWYVGESGWWWGEDNDQRTEVFESVADTLDARGEGSFLVRVPSSSNGRAARVTVEAAVTDINRQMVAASTTMLVHPADFYLAAKPLGSEYFWKAGTAQQVALAAVRPDGRKVAGVRISGTIVRREWHRVRRERDGVSALVGEWVSDTVAHCNVTSAEAAVPCTVTPQSGGVYVLTFQAKDARGREATTTFQRWAAGAGWVPWNDETQFKMDVIPDRTRYAVGDTATVMFASPFTDAEAWITVEREGLIEQRRLRLTSGSTTLKFPITETFAPNAFVSILVARGRSAPPGTLDDGGRPTIRVGYAELRVTPEVKRLALTVEPERKEYRPADSARVRVHVRDANGNGPRSEVTIWAVDEGVLALTGYQTPDPIDLLYRPRGLGMRLASNMTSVAPQIPEGEKGRREAGGGGGADGSDILRSRFQTTAFFLGSVRTDAQGNAVAVVKLPDNITTFRIMAVAVTAGDRYGKGESSMLVTRPLLARQALPRFIREGDTFTAGAVINRRDGTGARVSVKATATGVSLRGSPERSTTLAALRGAEVRFPFQAARGDSATFRFDVTDERDADAVRVTIPIRPDHHPVAHTIAGVLHDTGTVELNLPAGVDARRSRLSLNVGVSPLATIRGIERQLHVYPYYCTEQVLSAAVPLVALYRAQAVKLELRADIVRAVAMLASRQRADGGIGYWSSSDWTSAWLSAYAGLVLLDARDLGVKVDSVVLNRLAAYLTENLHGVANESFTPVATWDDRRDMRLRNQVAAVDFLSRFGRADVATENELLRTAAQLTLEDRARLAEVLVRRGQTTAARRLMEATWALVRVEGNRATLPDSSVTPFYFHSRMRPLARVLMATLALTPEHALVGPMAETLAQQGRAKAAEWMWNTQDYASAVSALAMLERRRRAQGERSIRVASGNRVLLEGTTAGGDGGRDSTVALEGLLSRAREGQTLRLRLTAGAGEGPVYYYLTVTEVPSAPPVIPTDNGIRVERWYEGYESGKPITSAVEGELVRVRLRLTVPRARYFVVLDDALPGGLEAVDLSLRTASVMPGPGAAVPDENATHEEEADRPAWYGRWDSGWWSPFDHREIRDDRVVYSATLLWPGTYTATYVARATTPGTFVRVPAHAEEMYNPATYGRSDGGSFVVAPRGR